MLVSTAQVIYPVPEQVICSTMHNQTGRNLSSVIVKMILVTYKFDAHPPPAL